MPTKLTTAWIAAQITLITVSFNGMSATLGWGLWLPSLVVLDAPNRSTTAWAPAHFPIWFAAEVAVLVLSIGLLRRNRERPPWLRLPSFAADPEGVIDRFSRLLHIGSIVFLIVAPLYAGGRFLLKTLEGDVYCEDALIVHEWLDHFRMIPTNGRCWLDGQERGIEFFVRWEAWTFLVAYVAVLIAWIRILQLITRRGSQPPNEPAQSTPTITIRAASS
jgi:hypothetical protein